MKKIVILFTLAITMLIAPVASVSAQSVSDSTIAVPAVSEDVPDTLVFNFDGKVVKVPTVAIQQALKQGGEIIVTVQNKAKEDPPKNPFEWILLIFTVLTTSGGLAFITEIRKAASDIVRFFGKDMHPVNFVILISGAIAAGISLLWNGGWNTVFFIGLWPTVFGIATFVYLKFLKKPKDETAKK